MSLETEYWDNDVVENFFKTFESELAYGAKLKTKEKMSLYVIEYIESWNNLKEGFRILTF